MMAIYRGFPYFPEGQLCAVSGADTSASRGVAVTSHATNANTMGSEVSLTFADYLGDCGFLTLSSGDSGVDFLADITDGSGNAIVSGLILSVPTAGSKWVTAVYQMNIRKACVFTPSVRCQSSTANKTLYAQWNAVTANTTLGYDFCNTIGSASGDSGGTEVDPGGTAHTKGSWVQFTASS